MDNMTAPTKEHRDRKPRNPGRFDDHFETRAVRRVGQRRGLDDLQALTSWSATTTSEHFGRLVDHDHRVRARDS